MQEINYLSYSQFIKDRLDFRKSGGAFYTDDFNMYDFPGQKYFKIMFYFGDSSINSNSYTGMANGLLHPTWEIFDESDESTNSSLGLEYRDYNTAWSYLKINDENERAEKLKKFVNLLSNISSKSPWYFASVTGIDSALERKVADDGKFDVSETKKLTIKCLPDSFDNRISTLLELYRDVTWSWIHKKEIIPANLRKFDMAIYIYETPTRFWHDDHNTLAMDNEDFKPSYKMLEFHDCEFSYNSEKAGWSELNNQTGVNPSHSIDISYADCFEISYNEQLMRQIGDIIMTDLYQAIIAEDGINVAKGDYEISEEQSDDQSQIDALDERWNRPMNEYSFIDSLDTFGLYHSFGNIADNGKHVPVLEAERVEYKTGFLQNAVGQLVVAVKDNVKEKLTRAFLGNLYTASLPKIGTQLQDLAKGNVIKTGQSIKQYIKDAQQRNYTTKTNGPIGNIFSKSTIANN